MDSPDTANANLTQKVHCKRGSKGLGSAHCSWRNGVSKCGVVHIPDGVGWATQPKAVVVVVVVVVSCPTDHANQLGASFGSIPSSGCSPPKVNPSFQRQVLTRVATERHQPNE